LRNINLQNGRKPNYLLGFWKRETFLQQHQQLKHSAPGRSAFSFYLRRVPGRTVHFYAKAGYAGGRSFGEKR
jgi:hypothetical protein